MYALSSVFLIFFPYVNWLACFPQFPFKSWVQFRLYWKKKQFNPCECRIYRCFTPPWPFCRTPPHELTLESIALPCKCSWTAGDTLAAALGSSSYDVSKGWGSPALGRLGYWRPKMVPAWIKNKKFCIKMQPGINKFGSCSCLFIYLWQQKLT